VLTWFPDGTGAGTYRSRSAIIELGEDARLRARSRFVAPGLDVLLHYYGGGYLYGDRLTMSELVQVFGDGSRSWNVVAAQLETDSPDDELPWSPLGERLVENGPDHWLGFVIELDRAVTWRWDRRLPVTGSAVVLEPLPAPGAPAPVTLLDGGVPGSVPFPRTVRDERTLVILTGAGAHAFDLPDAALLAQTELRFPEALLSRSRMIVLGTEAPPGAPIVSMVLRCLELR